jgi:hypothetical protein
VRGADAQVGQQHQEPAEPGINVVK